MTLVIVVFKCWYCRNLTSLKYSKLNSELLKQFFLICELIEVIQWLSTYSSTEIFMFYKICIIFRHFIHYLRANIAFVKILNYIGYFPVYSPSIVLVIWIVNILLKVCFRKLNVRGFFLPFCCFLSKYNRVAIYINI